MLKVIGLLINQNTYHYWYFK